MIKLIIARHGNTFEAGQTPTRAGARTDLPLTAKGYEQAEKIGKYLADNNLLPSRVIAAPLIRTTQTAKTALTSAGLTDIPVQSDAIFTEIDYGLDENKTDEEVIARIGQKALDDWNTFAKVPEGWLVNPQAIIQNWLDFAAALVKESEISAEDSVTLVVTSNGIARFAPYITGDFNRFSAEHNIKIGTGCLCIFAFDGNGWTCEEWNVKP